MTFKKNCSEILSVKLVKALHFGLEVRREHAKMKPDHDHDPCENTTMNQDNYRNTDYRQNSDDASVASGHSSTRRRGGGARRLLPCRRANRCCAGNEGSLRETRTMELTTTRKGETNRETYWLNRKGNTNRRENGYMNNV